MTSILGYETQVQIIPERMRDVNGVGRAFQELEANVSNEYTLPCFKRGRGWGDKPGSAQVKMVFI